MINFSRITERFGFGPKLYPLSNTFTELYIKQQKPREIGQKGAWEICIRKCNLRREV